MKIQEYFFLVFLSLLLFSVDVDAQNSKQQIMSDVMKAKNIQMPGLGMYIISQEDNNTVLLSKTGRYVLKGTVTDMWNGVQISDVKQLPAPKFPEMLDQNDFMLKFGVTGKPIVISYLSYSCLQCRSIVEQLMSETFLQNHDLRIFLVANSPEGKLILDDVMCSDNKQQSFKNRYLNRNVSNINKGCLGQFSKLNIDLANAQKIQTLPSTFYVNDNLVYLGVLPKKVL
jgi:hypothetical protein